MIAIGLSKIQALDTNPRAFDPLLNYKLILLEIWIVQEMKQLFFILEEAKKLFWTFHKEP